MLRSGNDLLNYMVFGIDGYLGPVRDIYFDDSEWVLRYLVIEMSEPATSSHYLISPLSIKNIRWEKKEIYVNIYYDKIVNSPEIDINLPISKQNEIALRRYYEWPIYWGQSEFFDTPPLPGFNKPSIPFDESSERFPDDEEYGHMREEPSDEELMESEFGRSEEDVVYSNNLRSYAEITGYRIETVDADNSFIADLIYNDSDWVINYLILDVGNTYSKEFILLTIKWISEIDWSKSRIKVTLNQECLDKAPRLSADQKITKEYEREINLYYDTFNHNI
jgi:sporulation protein YlmC with PRC-barrel domain